MENDYYYEPKIKTAREEDSVYSIKFYALNKQIETITNEKQQLISFLEDKIKGLKEKTKENLDRTDYLECLNKKIAFQEILDFVNKGGNGETK